MLKWLKLNWFTIFGWTLCACVNGIIFWVLLNLLAPVQPAGK